ncbi:hypothetical protein EGW08_002218 [Elysia chlorotica]|uniref:Swi5-dependent recombination DNA repair protein 1 homolog n=1 Tax=Elysia chlorotica TaxID=188477 RepID=A0A433U879_ELYCH|nr:hypothetical protein EGW08_002218 [Elysia chlorotica]
MSTSLKERLKRCGRYHAGSPSSVPKATQAQTPPHLVRSCSPPLSNTNISSDSSSSSESSHQKNSAKRKVHLCTGSECSEDGTVCNKQLNPGSSLPGKRRTMEASSESVIDTTYKGSLRTSIEQNSRDCLHNSDDISIKTNECAVNCDKLSKNSVGVCDSREEISTTSNREEKPALKPKCHSENSESLISQLHASDAELKEKLELLRKLKMVKMYREKNDLTMLQKLIDRWRSVSQAALTDLHCLHPEPRPALGDLIAHLQIDPGLVHYDAEEQDFL